MISQSPVLFVNDINGGAIAFIALFSFLIFGGIMGFICYSVVKSKGYPEEQNNGLHWGFWLGIIGLIVCACKPTYYDTEEGLKKKQELVQKNVNPTPVNINSETIEEQLTELKSLLQKGLITQEDFDAKKKQLLGL